MTDSRIQADAGRLETLAAIAYFTVIIGIVTRFLIAPLVRAFADPFDWVQYGQAVGVAFVDALPSILLAGAIHATWRLAARLRQGELFSAAVGKGVSGVGVSLLAGAVAMAVIAPWLLAVVTLDWGELGVRLTAEALVLAVIGLALMLLGRLLGRAAALKDELESYV